MESYQRGTSSHKSHFPSLIFLGFLPSHVLSLSVLLSSCICGSLCLRSLLSVLKLGGFNLLQIYLPARKTKQNKMIFSSLWLFPCMSWLLCFATISLKRSGRLSGPVGASDPGLCPGNRPAPGLGLPSTTLSAPPGCHSPQERGPGKALRDRLRAGRIRSAP